ncbi:MAG: hypothetical protein FWH53_05020 [Leptospirales bacterium]|nr:hypothetical protein [Leptospirales bacterium]
MYNITLICTNHGELGKCNSDELYEIIESISPDVIFEELSQDLFDRFYKENQFPYEPPEIQSIKMYLRNHNIKHFPVDIDVSKDLSTSEIEYMFNTFKKYDVYKKSDDELGIMTARDGFAFLNSKKCNELFEKKKITEKNLIGFMMINKNLLFRIHKLFYEEHDKREYEIIKNIYNYSKENQYNQALLLIGSAHRKSIIEKIEKYKTQENLKLNWTFYTD